MLGLGVFGYATGCLQGLFKSAYNILYRVSTRALDFVLGAVAFYVLESGDLMFWDCRSSSFGFRVGFWVLGFRGSVGNAQKL